MYCLAVDKWGLALIAWSPDGENYWDIEQWFWKTDFYDPLSFDWNGYDQYSYMESELEHSFFYESYEWLMDWYAIWQE